MPVYGSGIFHYKGSIRCRSGGRILIRVLMRTYAGRMEFCKERESLGYTLSEDDVCSACYRYARPVEFLVRSLQDSISLSIRWEDGERKLSAMPHSLSWFIEQQQLERPFGTSSHGVPFGLHCPSCAPSQEAPATHQGRKRVRKSSSFASRHRKKKMRV